MRNDRLYLTDIAEAIVRIQKYTAADPSALEHDELIQTWVIRHLEIIGEAVRCLSPELKNRHPEAPWRDIGRMRNKLAHQYFDIDLPTVRVVVDRDLPVLQQQIAAILRDDPGIRGDR